MHRDSINEQMSEMEREFELEMDDEFELENADSDGEFEDYAQEFEFEADDENEFENYEQEFEFEADDETNDAIELEFEDYEEETADSDGEFEWADAARGSYGERFYELSLREFETEAEMDEAFGKILSEMENEFFLSNVWKKAKGAAAGLARKGMALAKKAGINLPSLDALKSMLAPVAGALKGNLGTLFKTALAAHPAGAALLPALKGFGLETSIDGGDDREAFENYASIAREAFENLAETINPHADNPLEASRLATNAFQKSLKKHQHARLHGQNRRPHPSRIGKLARVGKTGKKRVRRVYAAPDEIIVVIQRKK